MNHLLSQQDSVMRGLSSILVVLLTVARHLVTSIRSYVAVPRHRAPALPFTADSQVGAVPPPILFLETPENDEHITDLRVMKDNDVTLLTTGLLPVLPLSARTLLPLVLQPPHRAAPPLGVGPVRAKGAAFSTRFLRNSTEGRSCDLKP